MYFVYFIYICTVFHRYLYLHSETFKDHDSLVEISLTGNRLVTIHPELFDGKHVPNLQVL